MEPTATDALHALMSLNEKHTGNPLLFGVCVQDAFATASGGDPNRLDVAAFTERLTTLLRRTSAYQERT